MAHTWSEVQPVGDADKYWYTSAMSDDGSKIIAGDSLRLYLSTNSGSSWSEVRPAGNADRSWQTSAMSSDGSVILAGIYSSTNDRLYLSTNSGTSWSEVQPAGDANKAWRTSAMSSGGSKIIAGVYNGRLYLSTNSGTNWSEVRPAGDVNKAWRTSSMSDDGSVILVGVNGGRLYLSTNSGTSWAEVKPAGSVDKAWLTSAMSSNGSVILAGIYSSTSGRLYLSTNSGTNWSEVRPAGDVNKSWQTTSMSSDGSKIIAGAYSGRLYLSTNSGTNWSEAQPAGDANKAWRTSAMSSSDGSKIIAGVYGGRLYLGTEEAGQNLTLSCAAGSYSLAGVACTLTYTGSAQNLTLACGAGSLALTGSNATFEVKRNYVLSVTQTTPDVVASGAGTTVVNGLYKYVNYEQYFKNDASAVVFKAVYGKWYVGGINGGVYYSAIKAVDTPDLVDNWQVEIDGTAPVPAFTVSPDVGGAFYSLAGYACMLTYTPAAQNLTLSCGAGSLALTGSNATFEVKRNYVLSVTQTTPDVVASGAGTTVVNGLYKYVNYEQYFKNDASAVVFKAVYGKWYVGGINGGVYYSAIKAVDTPDLVDNWQVEIDGTAPVPAFTVSPDVGGAFYSLAGYACMLTYTPAAQNLTLSCGAGSLALTGSNATFEVKRNYVLSVTQTTPDVVASGAGTTVVNGLYKYFNYGQYFKNDASALVFPFVYGQWYVMGINGGVYYSAIKAVDTPDLVDNWQVEIDGTAPVPAFTVSPDVGGAFYLLDGAECTLTVQRNYTLTAEAGTLALTGSACTLVRTGNAVLTAEAGSYVQSGSSASFEVKRNYTLACNAGSYALSGSAVTFAITRVYTLACGAGSYSLTGTDVSFGNTIAYTLTCSAGSYALTGSDVSFVIARNYSLSMGAGSYSLTGTDCTLSVIHTYSLSCGAGSYAITGTNAALTSARSLACSAGSYILTGLEADLFKRLVMPCGNGSYILTGSPATINSARTFVLGMGSYVLVGTDVGLYILTITPDCRTYFIDAENRTLIIGSEDRTHTIDAENRTLEVRCH